MTSTDAPHAGPGYRLRVPARQVEVPLLDEYQQQVVDHPGGPLLVLAGPGTGKTTTLVEAIVERIEVRGADPAQVLALTFSRRAAEQLRDRVTARLGRTVATPISATFHSFAYSLIRRFAPADLYDAPLRLLSAPEQDVILRELLVQHAESVRWPESLARATATRGFAREVHAVLGRAREKGLDGEQLIALGRENNLPEFVAAGLFLDQYLDVLDAIGSTDYADLIRRAVIEAETHRAELRSEIAHVFVDEYQDTDPGQVALLRALAGDGGNLVVVGDPHQSIYGFRGAEVRGILDFPAQFPTADGARAEVIALRTTRRFGPRVLVAAQRVASRLTLPGSIPLAAREAFSTPVAEPPSQVGNGRVVVRTFDTDRAEAEHLADLLRRAHLEDGIAWHDMAVLVRSGRSTLPGLRRALAAAGVPVEVAADEVALARDPAVMTLLEALRAVVDLDGEEHPLDAARSESLLLGPLGGLDAGDLRRLARVLRHRERELAAVEQRAPRTSRELLRRAVADSDGLDGVEGPEVSRARAVVTLLRGARAALDGGASPEEVLWQVWSGTGWPQRLRRAAESGGATARRAHRDLDAVCALFDLASWVGEQRDHLGLRAFVATLIAQEIPADTLAERGTRGSAVRLLTAHRSKGLEWRLVVLAHVQQDAWPDLRRRATLLGADRIGLEAGGQPDIVPPISVRELLMEERRLFYVACTRARERLVVTAVDSKDDDGEQASRFLAELGLEVEHVVGRPRRPLSMAGLIAELRRTVADETADPGLREAAAIRLARLAPEVRQADPASWWGTRAVSHATQPLRAPDLPVPMSASTLDALEVCPARWFFEREAGGASATHQAANLGQLVHALAEQVANGALPSDDIEALMAEVDAVWPRLEFRTPWSRTREHGRIRAALERFLTWHQNNPRPVLGTESRFETVVELDGGERVRLSGFADRLELATVEGAPAIVVVDFKTGRTMPSTKSVQSHLQLGLYQYAVDAGALDAVLPDHLAGTRSGGAELVQLGALGEAEQAVVQHQAAQPDDGPQRQHLRDRLSASAQMLRTETFPAIPSDECKKCAFVAICPAKSAGPVIA